MENLRIAGTVSDSVVDGPGIRYTIFTQGCPHHCDGCHNPDTHDPSGGSVADIPKILDQIEKNKLLKGVTFSGGEPFLQAKALFLLAKEIKNRRKDLNFIVYSGYTFEELLSLAEKDPAILSLLSECDLLIDGKFEKDQRKLSLMFRGSENQRVLSLKESLSKKSPVLYEFRRD